MLNLIGRIFLWLRGGSLKLLTLASIVLLIWGILSPVGTLMWWLNEGAESLGLRHNRPRQLPPTEAVRPSESNDKIDCYVVFLTGVGDFSANQLAPGEEYFLDQIEAAHPNCTTVRDVFPYSAANEGLGGQRLLAPLWRFAHEADGWLGVTYALINIRNLWRFAISVDNRYGPVYNQGIATAIVERMNAVQPITATSQPPQIILVGTSGGAQVALGAAIYLEKWLDSKITVVSVGGVFAGSNGFDAAERVYHLYGRRDWVEDIGEIVFPSRWPWTVGSPFNRARIRGRYSSQGSGPHAHDGPTGYFGEEEVGQSGEMYVDITLDVINQLPIWSPPDSKKS